jgi:hypothetical protein
MDPVLLLALGLFNYIQIMPFRSDLVSVTPIRLHFRAKIFVRTPRLFSLHVGRRYFLWIWKACCLAKNFNGQR